MRTFWWQLSRILQSFPFTSWCFYGTGSKGIYSQWKITLWQKWPKRGLNPSLRYPKLKKIKFCVYWKKKKATFKAHFYILLLVILECKCTLNCSVVCFLFYFCSSFFENYFLSLWLHLIGVWGGCVHYAVFDVVPLLLLLSKSNKNYKKKKLLLCYFPKR